MEQIDIHEIVKVGFGILSSADILGMSVALIDSHELEGTGTVYDERMGPVGDETVKCITCGLKRECPGHFGHIALNEPFIHPMYYKSVAIFLKCFCKGCYRILITDEKMEMDGYSRIQGWKRFNAMFDILTNTNICCHCNQPQPKITFRPKDCSIVCSHETKKDKKERGETKDKNEPKVSKIFIELSANQIKTIFSNITDTDIKTLGLDPQMIRPINMIFDYFPVIPPVARPYVSQDNGRCDDDLTYQLRDIIKANNKLLTVKTESEKQKLIQTIRFRISTTLNNSKGQAKQPTNARPIKCIKGRISGKTGQIRCNHMGKRTDYSARTVIGAEPTLKLGEMAIPVEVSKIETFPERVTDFNITKMQEIVDNDKANFILRNNGKIRINLQYAVNRRGTDLLYDDIVVKNGAKILEDDDGNIILEKNDDSIGSNLPENYHRVINRNVILEKGDRVIRNGKIIDVIYPSRNRIILKIGDIVERHLITGDTVLLNRQPTLHKNSMLAKRIVVMPNLTFRMNLACMKGYNGDFDGDEMNVFAPQSNEAKAELRELSATKHNIISSQESKPIIAITQDSLLGSYKLTKGFVPIDRGSFYDLTMSCEKVDGKELFDPVKMNKIVEVFSKFVKKDLDPLSALGFCGKGIISCILPPDLFYENKNDADPDEPVVRIYQGVLYEGVFNKAIIGPAHNSLIHVLNKEYGEDCVANFIDNIQFLTNRWLLTAGFSIGLKDCMIISEENTVMINETLTKCYIKAQSIKETTKNPGIREVRITAALNQAKDIGTRIAKNSMGKDNNFLQTVGAGSKGDYLNIAMITGLLGQQNLVGKRVQPNLNHGRRTMPHYPIDGPMNDEMEYESRGFISKSYIEGLNPQHFYFHAMSGREGICDKSCHKQQAASTRINSVSC